MNKESTLMAQTEGDLIPDQEDAGELLRSARRGAAMPDRGNGETIFNDGG